MTTAESPVSQLAGWGSNRKISRLASLDAFRGLAIVAMLIDHLALVTPLPDLLRVLPGRLAMPMFFLLAGYLTTLPRWRHAWIAAAGVALPFVVPWIDSPNVLVLWALGVVALWACGRYGVPVWLLAALGLTLGANGWAGGGGFYDPASMLGLMALGTALSRRAFDWAGRLPGQGLLTMIGRHPIAWYVGHLLVLQAALLVVGP